MPARTPRIRPIGRRPASFDLIVPPIWVIAAILLLVLAPRIVMAQSGQKKATKQPVSGTVTPSCLGCGGGDTSPPTVSFSPNGGTFSTSTITDTISWCDNQSLAQTSRVVQLNNVNLSNTYVTGTKSGCGAYAFTVVTLNLQSGTNYLYSQISDQLGNTGDNGNNFTYSPPTYTVTVSSDTASVTRDSHVDGMESFTVHNTGTAATDYTLTATCAGAAFVSCAVPGGVHLNSGPSTQVWASYTTGTGPAGASLTVRAVAVADTTISSSGSMHDSTTAMPTIVDASTLAWTGLDRRRCLTIAIVRNVAVECDAFRIAHPLPAVTTRNKARVPTLLYHSDQVYEAGVAVSVTAPTPTDSVQLNVYSRTWDGVVDTIPLRSRSYAPWTAGSAPQRLAVHGVGPSSNGIFRYRAVVSFWHSGTSTTSYVDGELLQTFRRGSDFGAGWWLAGVEQLVFNQGGPNYRPDSIVAWIGGDGSMQKYLWADSVGMQDVYLAAHVIDRPDTLIEDFSLPSTMRWIRHDEDNLRVYFDTYGRHTMTVNRLGDTTRFAWKVGGALRLDTIVVPGNLKYNFSYDGGDRLTSVTAPAIGAQQRIVQFIRDTLDGSPTYGIKKIKDADGDSVTFTWASWAGGDNFYGSRTDRRGITTTLNWESYGPGLSSATTPDGFGHIVTHSFQLAGDAGMYIASPPVPVDSVYSRYTDPRGNSSSFWLDALGSPEQIVNALGAVTTVRHDDARFPGLATETVSPSGLVARAWYNARGLMDSTTTFAPYADSRNATTRYSWDPSWAEPTVIHAPEGDSTRVGYDANGSLSWSEDGRGSATHTSYSYYSSGVAHELLYQVTSPSTGALAAATDSLRYDSLGNLDTTWTSIGSWRAIVRDAIGRPIKSSGNIYADSSAVIDSTLTGYDIMDRVIQNTMYGPANSAAPAQTVWVYSYYNPEGQLDSLARVQYPDPSRTSNLGNSYPSLGRVVTGWRYDNLGRRIAEIEPDTTPGTLTDNPVDSTFYDLNGNVDSIRTRQRDQGTGATYTIKFTYDALNRLKTRTVPDAHYPGRDEGIPVRDPSCTSTKYNAPYPLYPNDTSSVSAPCYPNWGGYKIAGEAASFDYDVLGDLIKADNADAEVRRAYYPNGQLRYDTLKIQTLDRNDWTKHVYALQYKYDRDAHLTALLHPPSLDSYQTSFAYDPASGALTTITDPLGYAFTYGYDSRMQPTSLVMPRGTTETYGYDQDGRLTSLLSTDGSTTYHNVAMAYDLRGKETLLQNIVGSKDTITTWYAGLGQVIFNQHIKHLNFPRFGGHLVRNAVDEQIRKYGAIAGYSRPGALLDRRSDAILGRRLWPPTVKRRGRWTG